MLCLYTVQCVCLSICVCVYAGIYNVGFYMTKDYCVWDSSTVLLYSPLGGGLMSASPCWLELSDCPDSEEQKEKEGTGQTRAPGDLQLNSVDSIRKRLGPV